MCCGKEVVQCANQKASSGVQWPREELSEVGESGLWVGLGARPQHRANRMRTGNPPPFLLRPTTTSTRHRLLSSCGPAVPPDRREAGGWAGRARVHSPITALARATLIRSRDLRSRKVTANFLASPPTPSQFQTRPPVEPGIPRGGAQAEMGSGGAFRGPWRRRRAEAQSWGRGGFPPLALQDGPLPSPLSRWGN